MASAQDGLLNYNGWVPANDGICAGTKNYGANPVVTSLTRGSWDNYRYQLEWTGAYDSLGRKVYFCDGPKTTETYLIRFSQELAACPMPPDGCASGAGGFMSCPGNSGPIGTPNGPGQNLGAPGAGGAPTGTPDGATPTPGGGDGGDGGIGGLGGGGNSCGREDASKPADAVGDPVLASTGNVYQAEVDFTSPYGLRLVRSYNSGMPGWVHNYMLRVIADASKADLIRPDGKMLSFTGSGLGVWTTNPTVVGQLTKLDPATDSGATWRFIDGNDTVERYNAAGMPISVTGRSGRALTFTASGALLQSVTDPWGRSIAFAYDAQNRMTGATVPGGQQIGYQYDAQGRLVTVVYPNSTTRQYRYEDTTKPMHLTGLIDENGNRFATWAYDTQGRAISATQALGAHAVSLIYGAASSSGSATQVTDALGAQRTLQFAATNGRSLFAGQTQPCTNCYGDAASKLVDPATGLITQSTDYLGINHLFTYDTQRKLPLSVTKAAARPEAQTVTTQWHSTWRLPVLITEAGRTTAYTYDANGNPITETVTDTASSQARTRSWTYNPQGLVATETAPNGGVTTYTYDSAGNRTGVQNALGHTSSYTYDAAGRVTQETLPTGLVTSYTYDLRGRLLTQNRGGLLSTFTYTPSGQVASLALPSGHAIAYQYDAAQRLTGWSDNRGAVGVYTLDALGNRTVEQIKDTLGNVLWSAARSINNLNRVTGETIGINQSTSYGYDANGERTSEINGLNQSTSYALDGLRRVTAITNATNATATLGYNALDAVTSASDFKGVGTAYARDALGNATSSASNDTGSHSTQYDALGLPTQIVDALGQATSIQRDLLGRPTQLTFADGKVTTLRYDRNNFGQLVTTPHPGVGYLYGIEERTADYLVSTSYERDVQGRIIQKYQWTNNNAAGPTYYTYTVNGLPSTVSYYNRFTYTHELLQYVYDSTGRITALNWKGQPLITNIQWNPLGQPKSWTWVFSSDGATANIPATRSYDTAGRVTATEFSSYNYDAAGRITSLSQQLYKPSDNNPANAGVTAATSTWTAGYDALGRIVSFGDGTNQASFTYDANGNRLTSTQTTGSSTATQTVTRNYTVEAASNKLLGFTQTTQGAGGTATTSVGYTYNGNGELTGDGLRSYTYNAENRLGAMTTGRADDSPTVRYAHNLMGQRVFKTEPLYPPLQGDENDPGFMQSLVNFFKKLWNPFHVPVEQLGWTYVYDEEGNLLQERGAGGVTTLGYINYLWLPTANGPIPVALTSFNRTYAIHTDHLNTPRKLTQSDGRAAWQWVYSAFGDEQPTLGKNRYANLEQTPNPGTTTIPEVTFNLRYPGQYFDKESGLHYNYHRSYSPGTGRYTQPDPIGLDGGWNRYSYVDGNPLRYTDPQGLFAIPAFIPFIPLVPVACALSPGCRDLFGPKYAKPPENARNPDGPKAPGKPGEAEGFKDPKGGENWVRNPNGRGYGWQGSDGGVWCPTGPDSGSTGDAHGGRHWDVQYPGGRYDNIYPGGRRR